MKPIARIADLIGEHEDWHRKKNNVPYDEPSISFKNCPGCPVCNEIEKLSIEAGMKSPKKKVVKKSDKPKAGDNMPKAEFTFDEYKKLKDEGHTNKAIAITFGISQSTVTKKVQQWEREEKKKSVSYSKEEDEYLDKILNGDPTERMNKLIQENAGLVAEVEALKKKITHLEASANDTENEAAAAVEYLKREEKLMIDLEDWKLQALQYKAENERLNRTLINERQEKDKYREEIQAAKAYIKAVI